MMEAQILNPLDGACWENEISAHPDAGFFHGSAWARVLHKTYGHRPLYLRCARGRDAAALVPMMEVASPLTGRRGVCLPFTDICAPLVFDDAAAPELLDKLREFGRERGWRHFETRGRSAMPADAQPATSFFGHTLDLRPGPDKLFAGFWGTVRTAIRKAERSDLRAQISHSREALHDFYRLHAQTRHRKGVPPQPLSFFTHIWEEIIKPKLGFVSLVLRSAQPIAAAVFFCRAAGQAVYKFSASDDAFQKLCPNNLMMWEAIRFLCDQGAQSLHFGRTSLGHEGLRKFKLAWGAQEESMAYYRFDLPRANWAVASDKASGMHNALFSRLPLALNRLAGTLIYPHLD